MPDSDSFFTFDPEVSPVCQVGMSDKRQAEPDSWLDVSCYVHEAELFRGRERFNDRFEPGTATITFSNDDGWADLVGAYSAVAAQKLRPGRQIRIGVRGPWNRGQAPFVRWLWRGFIDQAKPAYDPVEHDFVTVNCIDALGEAGSAVAPTGDFQGVNERVSERINRVLNAVGWWNSKRSIDATSTRVQGTELGGAAIDHMGQAADSAGGVVYGDLAGNVVFRDIDWMLYDADVAEDDEIGNCTPGTPPIDDQPPYHDPDPGPIHDPDDPPAEHPPRVCVCSDGHSGTIVEKGDLYRIYVKDGHLYYYSQGHTWDLGPYSGGCTCISPPTSNPDNPTTPLPPVRFDPPPDDPDAPEDTWPPFPDPAVPVPSEFAVEFLGYSDAGLSDPPAAAVTVAGIAPGHDCLLVVLIDALGSLANTVGLAPVVGGGGLDWAHSRGIDRTSGIASSFIVAAEVGRTDPGTFDVVVTWAVPMTSRTHIVTVWKVTAAVNDYLARFDAGAVLAAVLTSTPPEFINPGDGPVTVPLASDRQPFGVDALTRISDITIAQSLAEETTGPYGAVLFEADGPWTTPLFADIPAPPAPGLLAAGDFSDDFERADGPLGANWVAPAAYPAGSNPGSFTISGGAATSAAGVDAIAVYATPIPGPHFIEAEISNWHITGTSPGRIVNVGVLTRLRDDAFTGHSDRWTMAAAQDGGNVFSRYYDGGAGGVFDLNFISPAETFRLRVESTPPSRIQWYIDDILVFTDDVDEGTTVTGDMVGLWMRWSGPGTSPRIESVSIGALAHVCDDFERADGPLGASWQLGPGPGWAESLTPLAIESGAAVGTATLSATSPYTSNSMSWAAAAPPDATQSIEVTVENVWSGTSGQYAALMTNQTNGAKTSQFADFQFSLTTPGNGDIVITTFHFDDIGNASSPPGRVTVPRSTSEPVKLRLESDPDGTQRVYVDDALELTWIDPASVTGPLIGMALDNRDGTISPRILEACIGGASGGGIIRKCSWVAGWRQGITSSTVMVEDVNTGVDNIQSAQACLVLESAEAALGHRVLDYDLHADPTGATPGGTLLLTNQPRAGTFVVVFVGVTAIADVIDAVAVTGADFTRNHVQHKVGESWGQGSIWTCKVPLDVDLAGWAITVTYPDVESVSAVAYEVTAQDATTPVGGVASGVLGTIAAGSVDGPSSITMSAPGDVGGVGLAFLHVSAEPSTTSGAASLDGDEWDEDMHYSPAVHGGYLQTQSRAPGQEASTSTDVHWEDVQTGDAVTFSAVQLAVEVRHAADAFGTTGTADPVYLGGRTDAYDGPITTAKATDPLTGEIIWAFP